MLLVSISRAEYPRIYEEAFDRYIVDENGLLHFGKTKIKI